MVKERRQKVEPSQAWPQIRKPRDHVYRESRSERMRTSRDNRFENKRRNTQNTSERSTYKSQSRDEKLQDTFTQDSSYTWSGSLSYYTDDSDDYSTSEEERAEATLTSQTASYADTVSTYTFESSKGSSYASASYFEDTSILSSCDDLTDCSVSSGNSTVSTKGSAWKRRIKNRDKAIRAMRTKEMLKEKDANSEMESRDAGGERNRDSSVSRVGKTRGKKISNTGNDLSCKKRTEKISLLSTSSQDQTLRPRRSFVDIIGYGSCRTLSRDELSAQPSPRNFLVKSLFACGGGDPDDIVLDDNDVATDIEKYTDEPETPELEKSVSSSNLGTQDIEVTLAASPPTENDDNKESSLNEDPINNLDLGIKTEETEKSGKSIKSLPNPPVSNLKSDDMNSIASRNSKGSIRSKLNRIIRHKRSGSLTNVSIKSETSPKTSNIVNVRANINRFKKHVRQKSWRSNKTNDDDSHFFLLDDSTAASHSVASHKVRSDECPPLHNYQRQDVPQVDFGSFTEHSNTNMSLSPFQTDNSWHPPSTPVSPKVDYVGSSIERAFDVSSPWPFEESSTVRSTRFEC